MRMVGVFSMLSQVRRGETSRPLLETSVLPGIAWPRFSFFLVQVFEHQSNRRQAFFRFSLAQIQRRQ